jgi:hypothetical protein
MTGDAPLHKLWWVMPAAAALILALLAMLAGSPPEIPRSGSTFDAAPTGIRAAFLLLENLGYDVAISKRLAVGNARWELFPKTAKGEVAALDTWIRSGNRLLLADDTPEFAADLGLAVDPDVAKDKAIDLVIDGAKQRLEPGNQRVTPRERPDREWPAGAPEPLVGIFQHGKGEIWLLYRPMFLRNDLLRDADNAVVLCRLAEAFAGPDRVYFDEFFHGIRDRPGPVELLLRPPALWVTLQGMALLGVLLWRSLPRFGALQLPLESRRRSKEEFVDALAHLLELKGAYNEGFRAVRDALAREMEHALDLAPNTPPAELAAAATARGCDAAVLTRLLERDHLPRPYGPDYLRALNELERLRRAFFHERHD